MASYNKGARTVGLLVAWIMEYDRSMNGAS